MTPTATLAPAVPAPAGARTFRVDLRQLPHSARHALVYERIDEMGPDDAVLVTCEYEPRVLRWRVDEWWPETFDWAWEEAGPLLWCARITRRS